MSDEQQQQTLYRLRFCDRFGYWMTRFFNRREEADSYARAAEGAFATNIKIEETRVGEEECRWPTN
jgi:hypothetical protein